MSPDFFLVGGPRSGTTALCNYLRSHPEVFISSPKEPTYFGRDLVPKKYPTLDSYLALFADTGAANRAGDGSVAYLVSDTAAEEIHAFNPEASIVIMLRDPVEMVHSLHLKHYLMGIEPCRNLEDALAAEPDRLADGTGVPPGVCPKVIALRNRATYTPQVKRFLDRFGRDRVKLFRFEDFQEKPAVVLTEICRFLRVDESYRPKCSPHNVGRQVKSAGWHEFLTRSPQWAQWIARAAVPFPKLRNHIQRTLVRRNQHGGKPAPLSPELRAHLRSEFAPDIAALEELTGWDLSQWSGVKKAVSADR